MLNESITRQTNSESAAETGAHTAHQDSAEHRQLAARGWKLNSLRWRRTTRADSESSAYSWDIMQPGVHGWKRRTHLIMRYSKREICREQVWARVYREEVRSGMKEKIEEEEVCVGAWRWEAAEGRENTERERGADGALSLFTEWHHITTKFNLISTKLRQIHLDTASKKSWGARRAFLSLWRRTLFH